MCAYLRATAPEHAERRGDGVAAALDRELDDVLGVEVLRVGREARPGGVLDALVDWQDRHVPRAAEPAVVDHELEVPQHARACGRSPRPPGPRNRGRAGAASPWGCGPCGSAGCRPRARAAWRRRSRNWSRCGWQWQSWEWPILPKKSGRIRRGPSDRGRGGAFDQFATKECKPARGVCNALPAELLALPKLGMPGLARAADRSDAAAAVPTSVTPLSTTVEAPGRTGSAPSPGRFPPPGPAGWSRCPRVRRTRSRPPRRRPVRARALAASIAPGWFRSTISRRPGSPARRAGSRIDAERNAQLGRGVPVTRDREHQVANQGEDWGLGGRVLMRGIERASRSDMP